MIRGLNIFERNLNFFIEQPVKDVVITVPAYFNQAERRAMVDAAEIAGVNLLQLMNDNTAGKDRFLVELYTKRPIFLI